MRYLGLDYGEKRIGVAVSDENGTFAFPRDVIGAGSVESAIAAIKDIIKRENIKKIIIGLPLSSAGRQTLQSVAVEAFAVRLSDKVQLPIEFKNEILSTLQAKRQGISKDKRDASAAALILQSYLDKNNR